MSHRRCGVRLCLACGGGKMAHPRALHPLCHHGCALFFLTNAVTLIRITKEEKESCEKILTSGAKIVKDTTFEYNNKKIHWMLYLPEYEKVKFSEFLQFCLLKSFYIITQREVTL